MYLNKFTKEIDISLEDKSSREAINVCIYLFEGLLKEIEIDRYLIGQFEL